MKLAPDIRRILLVAPSWVGDVVMATPAVRALRRGFAGSRIVALATPAGSAVLENNPHVDRIVAADKQGVGPETGGRGDLVRLLRDERLDMAVVLPNSFRAALLAWRVGAKRRVGYAVQWRSWLLTDRVPPPREGGRIVPTNMVDRYLRLCAAVGCTDLTKDEKVFESDRDIVRANELLASLGVGATDELIVLIPGAAYGPSKLWGAERFAAAADALAERRRAKVLAHVGPGEEAVGRAVAGASRGSVLLAPPGAIDLRVLKAVIRRSALVIANDTGPRHYAVAYGVPNVAILGPTSRRYIDVNLDRTKLLQAEVDCGPCQRKVCRRDHRCMERITVAEVVKAAESLLPR